MMMMMMMTSLEEQEGVKTPALKSVMWCLEAEYFHCVSLGLDI